LTVFSLDLHTNDLTRNGGLFVSSFLEPFLDRSDADDYPKFTAAFSEAVKSPTKTTYGEELKTNVNMCEFYGRMIGQDSMRLMKKVASPAADKDEQKGTINELLWLHQQLASTNFFIDDAMLTLSFETGVDWRHVFYKLQSESVFYQDALNTRIQQLITTTL
jgi:hypothetical protein